MVNTWSFVRYQAVIFATLCHNQTNAETGAE
jgi:hypothetical protein